jgi:hypothetical protein
MATFCELEIIGKTCRGLFKYRIMALPEEAEEKEEKTHQDSRGPSPVSNSAPPEYES